MICQCCLWERRPYYHSPRNNTFPPLLCMRLRIHNQICGQSTIENYDLFRPHKRFLKIFRKGQFIPSVSVYFKKTIFPFIIWNIVRVGPTIFTKNPIVSTQIFQCGITLLGCGSMCHTLSAWRSWLSRIHPFSPGVIWRLSSFSIQASVSATKKHLGMFPSQIISYLAQLRIYLIGTTKYNIDAKFYTYKNWGANHGLTSVSRVIFNFCLLVVFCTWSNALLS